jgi:ABC-2 type transport system ATP-binding protein
VTPPGVIVTAEHLSKWYGQVIGLNDVTLSVPSGITGLLGPNGAGKSTFMKLITGQLMPSKGRLEVLGESIWQNPALYFRIGFCPEQDAFYDRMTGIAHDPELLILDEPLSGMDPLARRKTIGLIKEWGRSGKSVLVSSHILHEIEAMTANILLINQGRMLAEGNIHQIRDLIDEHPHMVYIKADQPRTLGREFLASDDVLNLKFEDHAVIVQTARPDAFYTRLTEIAASGELGAIHEVTSPDDNLQAVFQYLVKS